MECHGPKPVPVTVFRVVAGLCPAWTGRAPPTQQPNQFFQAHDPGPSGFPHDPQGPADIAGAALPLADTANTESLGSSFLLSHFGQAVLSLPKTRASNSCWHSLQTYSKMGIEILHEENY